MKLKSLYSEIEELGRQRYHLNDLHRHGTYILKYNKKKRIWEYYDVNERGGKSDLKIFTTEDEACKYVLNRAIEYIENSMKFTMYLQKEYLDEMLSYHSLIWRTRRQLTPFGNIILAIKELGRYKDDYLKKLDRSEVGRVYESEYNTDKKEWKYGLAYPLGEGEPTSKEFSTEAEVCQYAIDRAIGILRDFGEAWKEMIVEKRIKGSDSVETEKEGANE